MARGHQVSLFFTEIHPDQEQYSLRHGTYEGLPFFEAVHNHFFPTFGHTYRDEKMEEAFTQVLDEVKPELVHFQHLHLHSIGYIDLVEARKLPMVYTLHEYILMCPRMGQLLRPGLELCAGPEPRECARCSGMFCPPAADEVPLPSPPPEGLKRLPTWLQSTLGMPQEDPQWSSQGAEGEADPYVGAVIRRRQEIAQRLEKVNLFISPSAFLRQRFIDEGLIPPRRILFSDNGFPTELFERIERKAGDGLRFGFVGTIADFKGVHLLIEAFADIDDPMVTCQIHGDLEMFPDYKERLLGMDGVERVEFRGPFEHHRIGEVLAGIDVLIVPSLWYENSPLTIHEAFLAGVPVVTVDRGGMAELVEDGKNGLLFRLGNVDELRAKVLQLRRDPALLASLRRNFPKLKTIHEDAVQMETRYELLKEGKRPRS